METILQDHIHESQNLKHWFKEHTMQHFGGDIQKFSQNLPSFLCSQYSGKKTFAIL